MTPSSSTLPEAIVSHRPVVGDHDSAAVPFTVLFTGQGPRFCPVSSSNLVQQLQSAGVLSVHVVPECNLTILREQGVNLYSLRFFSSVYNNKGHLTRKYRVNTSKDISNITLYEPCLVFIQGEWKAATSPGCLG